MVRKARDYHAEQLRRNELARARGFTSRGQQRLAIEQGRFKAIQPTRIRVPKVKKKQAKLLKRELAKRDYQKLSAYDKAIRDLNLTPKQQATDWSLLHARSKMALYRRGKAEGLGVTKKAYTDAYVAAWIGTPDRPSYTNVRYSGGSEALRYWLVTLNGFMSASDYQLRYGGM